MLKLIIPIIIILLLPMYVSARTDGEDQALQYKLDVLIDPSNSSIEGTSLISVRKGQNFSLHLGDLKVNSITLNNKPLVPIQHEPVVNIEPEDDGLLEIRYEAVFRSTRIPEVSDPGSIENVIDNRGISLTGLWYPGVSGLSNYILTATLPEGYEAVSEADEITKTSKEGSVEFHFAFPHPLEGINFMASDRYTLLTDNFNAIEIYAYFFEEDSGLAAEYIAFTKRYLKQYEDMFGRYPFRRFSIVENFLPTGFSMPTFTLLGSSVVRLPFIVETSLGHEILHQWFGNLVYINSDDGNWSEGLTTYLADHYYKELKGTGWEYRKRIMVDYMSYLNKENDFPLKDFRRRFDHASSTVGYGKAAMVFHMLHNKLGNDAFYNALRNFIMNNRFQKASWNDMKSSFEDSYGGELGDFFSQWLDIPGLPEVTLDETALRSHENGFELSFSIKQNGQLYKLDVPVTIYTNGVGMKRFFSATEEKNDFSVFMSDEPDSIIIDEDYDMARMLQESEVPPVIAGILSGKDLIISIPETDPDIYSDVVDEFTDKGAEAKRAGEITHSMIKSSSVIVAGYDNPLVSKLFGRLDQPDAGFSITVKKNPWNPDKVIAIMQGKTGEEIKAGLRKMPHYGKYSAIYFDGGRNIYKSREESQRGIAIELKESVPAVALSAVSKLDHVIEAVSEKKIIYVGEFHDVFSHHAVQLDIIKGIFSNNNKIAIGMEMFQRPFQKVLDDYLEGKIDEREFLIKSEYYKRWRFDYNLYKPILRFARFNDIPVVAMNMDHVIIDKVSDGGIDSLTESELERLPADMDFSDREYMERIREIFKYHNNWEEKNFDHFYQSQILWDETMALSIDDFLRRNPGKQMVVIAGQGHLQFGSGIPKRTFRRNGETYSIILIDESLIDGIADHVVFPKTVDGITSPRLGVFLDTKEENLKISGFPHGSISEKAGLQTGDIIISIDGQITSSIEDVKIHLFYRKKGDLVRVKVLRSENDRQEEIEYKVRL